jgi:hypothetical protein
VRQACDENWRKSAIPWRWHASCSGKRDRGSSGLREFVMARFENIAFSLGIVLAGVLSLAAVPLA